MSSIHGDQRILGAILAPVVSITHRCSPESTIRAGESDDDLRRVLRNSFGPEVEARARFVGPLAIVSDCLGSCGGAECALEGSVFNRRELANAVGEDPKQTPEPWWRAPMSAGANRCSRGFVARFPSSCGRKEPGILLAQDQVGAGALFLHGSGQKLVFASEVCHLLRLLPRTPAPDEIAVVRWIASEDLDDGLTMFPGVRRLGAGRRISIISGVHHERRYWTPTYEPPLDGSRLEIAAQLKDALARAVALRTRGVESVGITLSGGFDSSAVAAVAAMVKPEEQRLYGYSTVFPGEPDMDDRDYLDVLSTTLPLTNVRYKVEPGGALQVALAYLRDWRLPLSGPGWVTELPLIRRAADDGIQVMLDGQGGDELFGVVPFFVADLIRSGRVFPAVSLVRRRFPGAHSKASWRPTARVLVQFGLRPALPHSLYSALRRLLGPERHSPSFLNDHASRVLGGSGTGLAWTRDAREPRWWLALRQLLIAEREAAGLGDFVRQRANWVGLEARPPLFDVDLITTALRVPPEFRFDPYLDRPIAREALAACFRIRSGYRDVRATSRRCTTAALPVLIFRSFGGFSGAIASRLGRGWRRRPYEACSTIRPPSGARTGTDGSARFGVAQRPNAGSARCLSLRSRRTLWIDRRWQGSSTRQRAESHFFSTNLSWT